MVVTAFQSASGIVNLITPTSAVVMGGLALAKVRYDQYLRFVLPLVGILVVLCAAFVTAAPCSRCDAQEQAGPGPRTWSGANCRPGGPCVHATGTSAPCRGGRDGGALVLRRRGAP